MLFVVLNCHLPKGKGRGRRLVRHIRIASRYVPHLRSGVLYREHGLGCP